MQVVDVYVGKMSGSLSMLHFCVSGVVGVRTVLKGVDLRNFCIIQRLKYRECRYNVHITCK